MNVMVPVAPGDARCAAGGNVRRAVVDADVGEVAGVYSRDPGELELDLADRGVARPIVGNLKAEQVDVALGGVTEQLVRDLAGCVMLKFHAEGGVGDRQLRIIAAVVA